MEDAEFYNKIADILAEHGADTETVGLVRTRDNRVVEVIEAARLLQICQDRSDG